MKDDKEKGREILKKRDDARKGLKPSQGGDPIEETEDREKKVADAALVVGLGARRSG